MNAAQKVRIKALREQGVTLGQLSRRFNVSEAKIKEVLMPRKLLDERNEYQNLLSDVMRFVWKQKDKNKRNEVYTVADRICVQLLEINKELDKISK